MTRSVLKHGTLRRFKTMSTRQIVHTLSLLEGPIKDAWDGVGIAAPSAPLPACATLFGFNTFSMNVTERMFDSGELILNLQFLNYTADPDPTRGPQVGDSEIEGFTMFFTKNYYKARVDVAKY